MDFVSDGLGDGRKFRSLNIVDDYSRECVAAEVDTSIPGRRVVRVLERLGERRGFPQILVTDHGPGVRGPGPGRLGLRTRRQAAFQSARKADSKRFHREFQRQDAG
jgi:transposase InsO family protein